MFRIIGQTDCSYCDRAKKLLGENQHAFVYHDIRHDAGLPEIADLLVLMKMRKLNTVPQIWHQHAPDLHPKYIGGYTELAAYLQQS